jgi:hypothetical protein
MTRWRLALDTEQTIRLVVADGRHQTVTDPSRDVLSRRCGAIELRLTRDNPPQHRVGETSHARTSQRIDLRHGNIDRNRRTSVVKMEDLHGRDQQM